MSEHHKNKPPSGDERSEQPVDDTIDSDGAPAIGEGETRTYLPESDATGQEIGPYRILEVLGEGGMGTVYLAEQRGSVTRRVALKIIKAGMDSGQVIARFEAERQALAMMDHDNIAKVFDAGTTDSGRPYFVMELVQGTRITKFCDNHKLGINQRLEIFRKVCNAVQHAHQKGIIHRDLKPSNILVTLQNDEPVPKVIDFGLAKATNQRLTEKTMFTAQGQVMGTLEYMSPEQANLNDLDVDTRSDIYSLGVILYELIAGSTPLTRESIRQAGLREILKLIQEEEAEKPSSRINHSSESLQSISSVRQTEPRKLSSIMRGELDWIVMKALNKERERRYDSPSAFAADIVRYLEGEPVMARPVSNAYRLKKFVKKNKVTAAATMAVGLALLIGAIVATSFATWALHEREIANEQKREAETLANRNERVVEAFTNAFGIPDPENPNYKADFTPTMVLQQARQEIDADDFDDDPLTRELLLTALADSFFGLGEYPDAIACYEDSLEILKDHYPVDDEVIINTNTNLANAVFKSGKPAEALELFQDNHDVCEAKFGPDHNLTLNAKRDVASVLLKIGHFEEAIDLLQVVIDSKYTSEEDAFVAKQSLSIAYQRLNRLDEAIELAEEVTPATENKHGRTSPQAMSARNNLALLYLGKRMYDKAIPAFEELRSDQLVKLGKGHPGTYYTAFNLASAYSDTRQLDKAIKLMEETHRVMQQEIGEDHHDTLYAEGMLAGAYVANGQPRKAHDLLKTTLVAYREAMGNESYETRQVMNGLAAVSLLVKEFELAKKHAEEHLEILGKIDSGSHLPNEVFLARLNLSTALAELDDVERATELIQENLDDKKCVTFARLLSLGALGLSQIRESAFEDAEASLSESYEGLDGLLDKQRPNYRWWNRRIGEYALELYQKWEKPERAEEWKNRLAALDQRLAAYRQGSE